MYKLSLVPSSWRPAEIIMASEFLHLRRQLEHELEAWTFAAHTVDRLGGGGGCGTFRSPEEARAAASKVTATRCALLILPCTCMAAHVAALRFSEQAR